MGGQRRYKMEADGYEVPVGARRHDLDDAVQAIVDDGRAGIFSADGQWRGPADDPLLVKLLEGPDRIRRGERVDGQDTLLAVAAGESFEDVQDRLYRARHYATPRMATRARIADALYAGIGAGLLEVVPPERVDATVDQVLARIADGDLPRSVLAYHCQGLREHLGLPDAEWTASADQAAERGRRMAAALRPSLEDPVDVAESADQLT